MGASAKFTREASDSYALVELIVGWSGIVVALIGTFYLWAY